MRKAGSLILKLVGKRHNLMIKQRPTNIYNSKIHLKIMIDVNEKKRKIVSYLNSMGPSLPVRISKVIEMDSMFTSALLSELLNEKRIISSNLKVGSSSLYFVKGQENKLEEFTDNLRHIEKEAYLKLKEKKILQDELEQPQIRVALRNIGDFAVPFKHKEKIYWRYVFTSEEEIEKALIKPKEKEDEKKEIKREEKPKEKVHEVKKPKETENIFEEEIQEKPGLLIEVEEILRKKEIELIEVIESGKREIIAKIKIKTILGELEFILIAKNKKTTSKEEIKIAVQKCIYEKMPCLFLLKKEPSKAIQKFAEEYKNILKIDTF